MASKPFHFKRFSVAQEHATHKVGTDGVLLGAWVNLREDDRHLLDIGTGTGVIALILAQRANAAARIDAVEIESRDTEEAKDNVAQSPWPDKVTVYHTMLQDFFPDRQYDLIVSNPPYFVNSTQAPEKKRTQARHTVTLPFTDLLERIARLLNKTGRCALILPCTETMEFLRLARAHRLFPIRKTFFRSRADKPVERILFELAYDGECGAVNEIVLFDENNQWSDDYKMITRDFYLKA